jgi:hypothetical protein
MTIGDWAVAVDVQTTIMMRDMNVVTLTIRLQPDIIRQYPFWSSSSHSPFGIWMRRIPDEDVGRCASRMPGQRL